MRVNSAPRRDPARCVWFLWALLPGSRCMRSTGAVAGDIIHAGRVQQEGTGPETKSE
ncbi:hypothetical protein DPMN_043700 [Dreissena polymorpha]|uniref:Uncharacterized protein n=1 Tax=Dreissena polymorpha TaxID=45954 RepID=A0A9D4HY66_DREPO|nr:hypothetical protein DPMN_043700 [Dreissena polymorpha]